MLAPSIVAKIRCLLAEDKLSQRKIAKLTGISRGTVGAIARGRRPDYQQRPKTNDESDRPSGPPQRCGTCGGMVHMPCRLCGLRKQLASAAKSRRRDAQSEVSSGLELWPQHQKQYEEVRTARAEAERLEMERIASGEMDRKFAVYEARREKKCRSC